MAVRRILIAPDSFKGTFTAVQVAGALARGAQLAGLEPEPCPVADGGEGTIEVMLASVGGRLVESSAHDPLGRDLRGAYALLGDGGCALVETATASGLALLPPEELDPWRASTYGTGELISHAARLGVTEVIVAVGGSATVDGGRGALRAIAERGGTCGARIVVLCDVDTTWERCAEIYGPQKGADQHAVRRLSARLDEYARELPRDPRGVPMTGAGGGLSGGLWAALGAELRPGAAYVLDLVGFDARLREADVVLTGEGSLDSQTPMGKIVGEVARRTREAGVPLHAIVGRADADHEALAALGVRSVTEAGTLAELEQVAQQLGRKLVSS